MQLPNAPLTEVVFELRWRIEQPSGSEPLGYDPGYPFLADQFADEAREKGYTAQEELNVGAPALAYSPNIRFRRAPEEQFPLLQIGHGIYACNMGPDYEWSSFREVISTGLQALLKSHPRNKYAPLVPNRLELRYIDTFDESLLGHSDLERFLSENTKFGYNGFDYFQSDKFDNTSNGSLIRLRKPLVDKDLGWFQLEIGTGKNQDEPTILLTSRVVLEDTQLELGTRPDTFTKNVIKWANRSHEITHAFFWEFVTADLMTTFSNENK